LAAATASLALSAFAKSLFIFESYSADAGLDLPALLQDASSKKLKNTMAVKEETFVMFFLVLLPTLPGFRLAPFGLIVFRCFTAVD